MNKELNELEDQIATLARKRDQCLIDANNLQKQLLDLQEKYHSLSPEYEKLVCLTCGGQGYFQDEESGKKVKCSNPQLPGLSCGGKGYIWLKKYDKPISKL